MKTHHSTHQNKQVITVPAGGGKYAVVERRANPGEPEYVVYETGGRADSIAHFYSLNEAKAYADWRSTQPSLWSLRAP